MSEVIAALDSSLAATPVLATARALADLLDATVVPLHISDDGARVAENVAERAGLTLRTRRGPIVAGLLEEAKQDHVLALVLGARAIPGDRRPLGSTALAVATATRKPIVVVPPDVRATSGLRRVLIPIEGDFSSGFTPGAIIKLAQGRALEVTAVHVKEPESLPAFTDQPQHQQTAWTREFLRRYCPWGIDAIDLQVRIGNAAEIVPAVAEESGVDIIALAWAQELAEGRAQIVRAALTRANLPVMLVPVELSADADQPLTREEASSWNRSQLSSV